MITPHPTPLASPTPKPKTQNTPSPPATLPVHPPNPRPFHPPRPPSFLLYTPPTLIYTPLIADPIASSTATATADNQDISLLQVMYAMEAAEATIKQQVEYNIRLRAQLEYKILELHRYKLHESMAAQLPPSARES
ncbi:hypothetical protein EV1_030284 [Malus domestica]